MTRPLPRCQQELPWSSASGHWPRLLAIAPPLAQAQADAGPISVSSIPPAANRARRSGSSWAGRAWTTSTGVIVSGKGVSARVVEYHRRLDPQEIQLLHEQDCDLQQSCAASMAARSTARAGHDDLGDAMMSSGTASSGQRRAKAEEDADQQLIARIETRIANTCHGRQHLDRQPIVLSRSPWPPTPSPAAREIRLATPAGCRTPWCSTSAKLPEVCRKPMLTSQFAGARQGGSAPAPPAGRRGRGPHHRALHRQRPDRLRRGEPLSFRGPQGSAAGDLVPRRGN